MASLKNKKIIIFIVLIFVVAVFFRLWQINSIPPGLYPDVAINGNEALEILKTKNFQIFYPENNGREGFFFWLIALSFAIFGPSVFAIKLTATIIGILTVIGFYFLTKELFKPLRITNLNELRINNPENIALFSTLFLATSFWHVNFSRFGFRAIMLPFVLIFFFYFLLRGFRRQKTIDFILAGLFFGAGFYTYISFRLAVLFLFGYIGLKKLEYFKKEGYKFSFSWVWKNFSWLWKKMLIKDGGWRVLLFFFVVFIVALPLGIYFLEHPRDFISRATGISVFKQEKPFFEFGKSLLAHLGMFNVYGDPNWRHNYAGSPMLFWPVGIAFIIGVILSIKEIIVSSRNKNYPLSTIHYSLFLWFVSLLLPGILTSEGIPHSLRVIGAIPPVFIFAGMGADYLWQKIKKLLERKNLLRSPIIIIALAILVFAFIYAQYTTYFELWGKNKETEGAFTKRFADIGNYLNTLPESVQKYVIVNENGVAVPFPDGLPMPAQTIMFLENAKFGRLRSVYLKKDEIDKINFQGQPTVIIPMAFDENIEKTLKEKFPQGTKIEVNGVLIYQLLVEN